MYDRGPVPAPREESLRMRAKWLLALFAFVDWQR